MATVNLSQWYPDVSPYVNGCPLALQLAKIREAAIRFCRESRAWRTLAVTDIDVIAGQQTYVPAVGATLGTLPAGSKIVHVFVARFQGAPLDIVTPEEFRAQSDTWDTDQGTPEALTLFMEGELSLFRIPSANAAGALELPDVALAPTQAATTIDARIYEEHRNAIAKGARALLHSVPKKPYTDLQLGMSLERDFVQAIGSAAARVASARGNARLRTSTNIRR